MWQYAHTQPQRCPQSLSAEKKKVAEVDIRLRLSWYLAHITKMWGFLLSHTPFGWLPTSMAVLNLVAAVLSFTIKPTISGTCLGRKKSHSDFWAEEWFELIRPVFQEDMNVHGEASDHRARRRWGMRKCNYNLMVRAVVVLKPDSL